MLGNKKVLPGVHVRYILRTDIQEVLQIENTSFIAPWSEEEFVRCLRERRCNGMVAEYDEKIVGFMIFQIHKNRLHLLNFAVHDGFRRREVGTRMANRLKSKLSAQDQSRILLEVRETNVSAQLFFQKNGFRAVSVLRDFYDDTSEDAYVMQYRWQS